MRPQSTAGFTVIEMMIVVSIIAILGALLFPVFARAREKAHSIVCASNLRNMGLALRVYSSEHHGHFPPTDNDLWPLWSKHLSDAEVLQCPTVSKLQRALPGWQAPGRRHDPVGFPCDYAYRGGLQDDVAPKLVVVADDTVDRHNEGSNFLFVDGHSKWLRKPGYGGDEPIEGIEGLEELRKLMVQGQWREPTMPWGEEGRP